MTDSSSTPTHEQIAQRAYEIFIERGRPEGQDLAHWLEAERQLAAAGQKQQASPQPVLRSSAPSNGGTEAAIAAARAPQGNGRARTTARPAARK